MSGELKIVASEDLGGLGHNESAPVICSMDWTPPYLESLPWLLLAGALLVDRRGGRRNGWIVLALAAGCGLVWTLTQVLTFVPPEVSEVAQPLFWAAVYGVAMMCLCSRWFASSSRSLAFLKMLLVMGPAGALMLYGSIDVDNERVVLPSFVGLLMLWAGTMAGSALAGWACRYRANFLLFMAALLAGCFGLLFAVCSAFMLAGNQTVQWGLVLAIAGVMSGALVVVLAPLIWVLFQVPSQRPRLQELLHLAPAVTPILSEL